MRRVRRSFRRMPQVYILRNPHLDYRISAYQIKWKEKKNSHKQPYKIFPPDGILIFEQTRNQQCRKNKNRCQQIDFYDIYQHKNHPL